MGEELGEEFLAAGLAVGCGVVVLGSEGGSELALYRYWRQKQTGGRLALVLITGTQPGVMAGR